MKNGFGKAHAALIGGLALAAAAALPGQGQAAVTYRFEVFDLDGASTGHFQFTTPTFITGDVSVPIDQMDSCSAPAGLTCKTSGFYSDSTPFIGGEGYDIVGRGLTWSTTYYYFADGALSQPGVYHAQVFLNDDAVLTVSGSAIPEPTTWAMLILGFGVAGGALRYGRRRSSGALATP